MFRDIKVTNGKYSVDENGQVKRNETGLILKGHINNKGYLYVDLRIDGMTKKFLVHRLVAMEFVPNPDPGKYNIVNHLDCNPLNCCASNLEWCDYSRNNKYGYDCGRKPLTIAQKLARSKPKTTLRKKVTKYKLDGTLVAEYDCITDAAKSVSDNVSSVSGVSACCHGYKKAYMGFLWKFC